MPLNSLTTKKNPAHAGTQAGNNNLFFKQANNGCRAAANTFLRGCGRHFKPEMKATDNAIPNTE